jgi:rhomboid protease GluP
VNNPYPVNKVPPVIVGLCIVIFLVEAALSLSGATLIGGQQGIGWRSIAISDYGFSPEVLEQVVERGDYSFDMLKRFIGYAFVHGNFTQALFGLAILLALGKFVGDVFHPMAVLAIFVLAAIAGAVAYGIVMTGRYPLIGVYPADYGLIGAFTYIQWLRLGQMGENQLRAFQMIAFLMAIQLLFALLFGGDPTWVADVGGFLTGLFLSTIVAPGGWSAFMRRMRKR